MNEQEQSHFSQAAKPSGKRLHEPAFVGAAPSAMEPCSLPSCENTDAESDCQGAEAPLQNLVWSPFCHGAGPNKLRIALNLALFGPALEVGDVWLGVV